MKKALRSTNSCRVLLLNWAFTLYTAALHYFSNFTGFHGICDVLLERTNHIQKGASSFVASFPRRAKLLCGFAVCCFIFDKELMHIWSLSLYLALICFTCSVHSRCNDDSQCDQRQVCCGKLICASRSVCGRRCTSDIACSFGDKCDTSSGECVSSTPTPTEIPTWPWFRSVPTFKWYTTDNDRCYWDSDCFGSSTCVYGRCTLDNENDYTDTDHDEGGLTWSTTKIVGIIFFAVVASVISCLYHMCKRARKPPVLETRNAQATTRVVGEATNTTLATDHEMRPTGNNVSNGGIVIAVEEVNEVSPPLPPGAPPPYSTLEFESQQQNETDEQPPPSYDEAVRNSTMALA